MAGPAGPANPARQAPATKAARQARIVAILSREQVHSQEQLASLLDQYAGRHVTQGTPSPDPGDPGGHGSPAGTSFDYPERVQPDPDPPIATPSSLQTTVVAQAPRAPSGPGRTSGQVTDSGTVGAASSRLVRYLKELLTSAEASANLVVLRTPAGAAQLLASVIDHAAWPAILGTVAGDDTVLVISRDPAGGEALAVEFLRLAEHRRP